LPGMKGSPIRVRRARRNELEEEDGTRRIRA
jgi:hypothetical protein